MTVWLVVHDDSEGNETVRFVCASRELAERCRALEETPGSEHDEYCCRIPEEEVLGALPALEHGPSARYRPSQGPPLFSPLLAEHMLDQMIEAAVRPSPYRDLIGR